MSPLWRMLQSLGLVDVPDGGDLSPTTSCDEADAKYVVCPNH